MPISRSVAKSASSVNVSSEIKEPTISANVLIGLPAANEISPLGVANSSSIIARTSADKMLFTFLIYRK